MSNWISCTTEGPLVETEKVRSDRLPRPAAGRSPPGGSCGIQKYSQVRVHPGLALFLDPRPLVVCRMRPGNEAALFPRCSLVPNTCKPAVWGLGTRLPCYHIVTTYPDLPEYLQLIVECSDR